MTQHVRFKAGDVLFHQGDDGDRVLQINTGGVEISRKVGRESVVLGYVQGGEWVGEMGVMEHRPRSATARAVADGSAEILTVQEFLDQVAGDPRCGARASPPSQYQAHDRGQDRRRPDKYGPNAN